MLRVDLHAHGPSNGSYSVDNHCTDMYGFLATNVYLQIPSARGKAYVQPINWSENMLPSPLQYVLAVGKRGQRITLGFLNEYLRKDEKFRQFCFDMCRLPPYDTFDKGENDLSTTQGKIQFKEAVEGFVKSVDLKEQTKRVTNRYGQVTTLHDYWILADEYVIQRVNDAFRQVAPFLHPDKPGGSEEKVKLLEDIKSKMFKMIDAVVEQSGVQRKYLQRKELMSPGLQKVFNAILLREFGAGRFLCSSVHPVQISLEDQRNHNTSIYGKRFECDDFILSYAHDPTNPMPAA